LAVFDVSVLNTAVAGAFCDKTAIWGAATISIALTIDETFDEETYRIAGESITADCLASSVTAMKRGDSLTIDSVSYSVLAVHRDGSGWAKITLEKA
jgi:hypothetical protein